MGINLSNLTTTKVRKKKKRRDVNNISSNVVERKPRKRKEIQGTLRKGEPGINIPTSNYRTVAQYCNCKEDTVTHFFNTTLRKLRCSYCGSTKSLK